LLELLGERHAANGRLLVRQLQRCLDLTAEKTIASGASWTLLAGFAAESLDRGILGRQVDIRAVARPALCAYAGSMSWTRNLGVLGVDRQGRRTRQARAADEQ
jgi:hypothetical protein